MTIPKSKILLGKYKIINVLGKGGWYDVHLAEDVRLGRSVAIKHLHPELTRDKTALERVLQEAKIVAGLRHRNIVTLYALEQDGDDHYMIMEPAENGTLADLMAREGMLPIPKALDLMTEMCLALNVVHSKGIIHRNIRPGNIWLFEDSEGGVTPKLADFGAAWTPLSPQHPAKVSVAPDNSETNAYLAPEQAQGKQVDARSDIYALGLVLYEMLTGKLPYSGNHVEILLGKTEWKLTPPKEIRQDISDALEQFVLKALSKEPENRFQTTRGMAVALRSLKVEKPVRVVRPPQLTSPQQPVGLLPPGETILNGQYTIEKHLGSGSQGEVYLAHHRISGQLAIKRLYRHIAARPETLERFERELQITNQLHGEHVIFIRNFFKDSARDEWFSVMEYANAGSLADRLAAEAPLPIVGAIKLTITLCRVLARVHQYPYVHGDLKPSNILFNTSPIRKFNLILGDFSRAFQPIRAGVLPLPPGLKTTRKGLYVSPELLEAGDPENTEPLKIDVDQRADIYAIGVILYEMLTGHPPFWESPAPAGDPEDGRERERILVQKIKYQIPPEPKIRRSEILPSLNAVLMTALAKNPAHRFASVDELRASLEEILPEEEARLAVLSRLQPLVEQALADRQWGRATDLLYNMLDKAPNDSNILRRLKKANEQQKLLSLRHKIRRKMNEGLWREAKELVTEALDIAPADVTLVTWQEKINDQLIIMRILNEARKAEENENWRKALDLYQKALELDPGHSEAAGRAGRAQTQYQIATLRRDIETLSKQGRKQEQLEKLNELLNITPHDKVLMARIETLQKVIEPETYYVRGKQAYKEGRWAEAINAFEKVLAVDSFYHQGETSSVAALKLEAEKKLAQEKTRSFGLSSRRKVQSQAKKHRLLRSKVQLRFNPAGIGAGLKQIWRPLVYNKALVGVVVMSFLVILAVSRWFPDTFVPSRVDKVRVFVNGRQVDEGFVGSEPISLSRLPSLADRDAITIKVEVVDNHQVTYSGDDELKCRWAVAPIDEESENITTESCEALYVPSPKRSSQKIVVEVEGAKQQFKPAPPVTMKFELGD